MEIGKRVEKFIQEHTRNTYNYNSYAQDPMPWLSIDEARKAVEIAREETLDKVCKYIKDNLYKNLYVYKGEAGFPTFQFIEDIKQAMKDE